MAHPSSIASSLEVESPAVITFDGQAYDVVEVRATGDVILDVEFQNSAACNKSIPVNALRGLRARNMPIQPTRVLYRVRLDTLKKHSKYFNHLLSSDVFGEGREVSTKLAEIAAGDRKASELPPDALPVIRIVDEEDATRTWGRETVFRDLLQIMHAAEHLSKNITLLYLSNLVVMADRYDCVKIIARYVLVTFRRFKYPVTLKMSHEETLRQKILVFYYTDQAGSFAAATKELITRGSIRWNAAKEAKNGLAAWWDLPGDLEIELEQRRLSILRTIASLQNYFLDQYTSRAQQCALGYGSSAACDSFQLGEMIKFMIRKDLFQVTISEGNEITWPIAYSGDIEQLICSFRQCPSYQIDKDHRHCGLRVKILPPLEHIQEAVQQGTGVRISLWKLDRANQSWVKPLEGVGKKKKFIVNDEIATEDTSPFNFPIDTQSALELSSTSFGWDSLAKKMFTASIWEWESKDRDERGRDLSRSTRDLRPVRLELGGIVWNRRR